jgi:hypothetical protein
MSAPLKVPCCGSRCTQPRAMGVDGRPGASPNLDDEVRHIDEMNRTIQADSDAMNAAIQATNAAKPRHSSKFSFSKAWQTCRCSKTSGAHSRACEAKKPRLPGLRPRRLRPPIARLPNRDSPALPLRHDNPTNSHGGRAVPCRTLEHRRIVVLLRFVVLVEPAHLVMTARRRLARRAGRDPPLKAGLAIYRHRHALVVFIDRNEERRGLRNADKLRAHCAHGHNIPNTSAATQGGRKKRPEQTAYSRRFSSAKFHFVEEHS